MLQSPDAQWLLAFIVWWPALKFGLLLLPPLASLFLPSLELPIAGIGWGPQLAIPRWQSKTQSSLSLQSQLQVDANPVNGWCTVQEHLCWCLGFRRPCPYLLCNLSSSTCLKNFKSWFCLRTSCIPPTLSTTKWLMIIFTTLSHFASRKFWIFLNFSS